MLTTTTNPKNLLPHLESLGLIYPRVSPATLVENFEYAIDTYEADIYLDDIRTLAEVMVAYVNAAEPIMQQLAKEREEQEKQEEE